MNRTQKKTALFSPNSLIVYNIIITIMNCACRLRMELSLDTITLNHTMTVWKYFQNCYPLESRNMPDDR